MFFLEITPCLAMDCSIVPQDISQSRSTHEAVCFTTSDSIENTVQDTLNKILEEIQDINSIHNVSEDEILKMKDDQYAYTKTQRFTSEIYKLEIGNLPNFFGYGRNILNLSF